MDNNKNINNNVTSQNNNSSVNKVSNQNRNLGSKAMLRKNSYNRSQPSQNSNTISNKSKLSRAKNMYNNIRKARAQKEALEDANDELMQEEQQNIVAQKAKEAVTAKVKAKVATAILSSNIVIIFVLVLIAVIISVLMLSCAAVNGDLFDFGIGLRRASSGNYACASSSTSPISVTQTKLSRSEFIELVNSYDSNNSHYQKFKEHAGEIYDLGIKLGINPELPVIRAFNEGFSPGIVNGVDSYNYWGIGCYNGTSNYSKYNSFMDGVRGYYDVLLSYNTNSIVDVMYKYAYIGDQWYFPGSSSKGGCYYSKYIMPYLSKISPSRADEVSLTCQSGTQIPTNSQDQTAYTQYQVNDTIMAYRKKIFHLDADSVGICSAFRVNLTANPTNRALASIISSSVGGSTKQILAAKSQSVDSFNDNLYQVVKNAKPGSREAVGKAAIFLVNSFEMNGYIIPYSWAGGHGSNYTDASGNFHNYSVHTYYGINPFWGETIYSDGHQGYYYGGKKYNSLGLDCSGFVAWALRNGGVDYPLVNAKDYKTTGKVKTYKVTDTNKYIGQTGDVLSSDKHVSLILAYDKNKNAYLVAEENGLDYGLIIQYRYISSLATNEYNYRVVDMSYYYENHKTQDFENKFNSGRIK